MTWVAANAFRVQMIAISRFCKSTFPSEQDLHGLKIVVDCANGAGYHVAPKVFHELGANVSIGCEPNGFNINKNVGATHTETLQQAVLAKDKPITEWPWMVMATA